MSNIGGNIGNKKSCPTTLVGYDNHSFIGKKFSEQVLGWDYSNFAYDFNNDSLFVIFTDNNSGYNGGGFAAPDITNLIQKFNDEFANWGANSTQLEVVAQGNFFYIKVIGSVIDNLQITIRNDNTGVWGDGIPDPEGDGLEGIKPYLFSINSINSTNECEAIEIANGTFDCSTDKALVYNQYGGGQIVDGLVIGWSQPEGVQWSNISAFDNRIFRLEVTIETDGLPSYSMPAISSSYVTFQELLNVFNAELVTYGSSYRLLGATDNRIFLTQSDGTTIIQSSTDPYMVTNLFNQLSLVIEDNVTNNDWLVKGTNPKDFTVSNVQANGGAGGLKWVSLPCPTEFSNVVYVDTVDPNSASIFDLENPPVTNNPSLQSDTANIYIGTDGSTWVYNTATTTYITKVIPASTEFYLANTTTDAGANKAGAIWRPGKLGIGGANPMGDLDIQRAGDVLLRLFNTTANYWDITNRTNGVLNLERAGIKYMTLDQFGQAGFNNTNPTSTFHTLGSVANSIVDISSTITLNGTLYKIIVNNGATNIIINLPNPLTCVGRNYIFTRGANSTGTITLATSGGGQLQALAGTYGTTTSLGLHGATGQGLNHSFTAYNQAGLGVWARI